MNRKQCNVWNFLFLFLFGFSFLTRAQEPTILTLDDAINIAMAESYDMRLLRLRIIRAREGLTAARGKFRTQAYMNFDLPEYSKELTSVQQTYGFSVYNTRGTRRYQGNFYLVQPLPTNGSITLKSSAYHLSESFLTSNNADTTTNRVSTSINLEFTQPLFTINSLKYGLKRAQLNFESTQKSSSRYELNLKYNVTSGFYTLYQATRQFEIAESEAKQQEEAYKLATRKYEAGLIPEVEVLQIEVDFAESQNKRLEAAANLKEQEDEFKQLIGLELDQKIAVRTDFSYTLFEIDSVKALNAALKYRSEIRENEINLELAKMGVKEAESDGEISGDLTAFYNFSGISSDNLIDDSAGNLWNSSISDLKNRPRNKGVVFSLTVPLWDWGVNKAEVQAAKVDVQTAEYDLLEIKKTITREIRAVINQVKESANRLEVLKKSDALAQRSYEINTKRFENGDITSQDLALDQQRLTSAKQAYLNAFITYKLAIADLTRKTMYDFEKNVSLAE